MKKTIIFLLIFLLFAPAIHAEDGFEIVLRDYPPLVASFDNCTKISQEEIPSGNFTTLNNHTFHWENAHKITYKNNENKTDYFIVWKCPQNEEYFALYFMHPLRDYYSDYALDNTSVVYMEILNDTQVCGILLDTQNITCTEEDLVHNILGLDSYELTNYNSSNTTYVAQTTSMEYDFPIDLIDASNPIKHYRSPKMSPYEMARSDPDWYYDHYDYGDNADLDEYLYDQGYYYDDE